MRQISKQRDRVIQIMQPVKGMILGWGIGNHEIKLFNTADFGQEISAALEAPYGAWTFKLHFNDVKGRLMFKTLHTHGKQQLSSNAKDDIQYDANRRAALKMQLQKSGFSDHIYASRGHDHQLLVVEPTVANKLYLTDNGTGIKQHYHQSVPQNAKVIPPDNRWFATTGSFRKLYSKPGTRFIDYGEVAGYAPSEVGCVKVTVQDRQVVTVEKVVA